MNPFPDRPSDEDEELMRQYLAEAGDPQVTPAPEHVAQVRSLLLERLEQPVRTRSASRWTARLVVGAAMAAAVIAIATMFVARPTIAWAQVVEAVRTKSWIHSRLTGPDGQDLGESWLSSDHQWAAAKHGPSVTFHDHLQKVFSKYVPEEDAIYRLPEPAPGTPDSENFLEGLFRQLDKPQQFAFPGMEMIGQVKREVERDGDKWNEIEMTFKVAGGSRGGPVSMRVRVDPKTKLPTSMAIQDEDGKWYTAAIDYPERGPADIYDLGIPRTAKVIDRSLPDEVGQVLSELKKGRLQFDDYCAYVTEERTKPDYQPPFQAYRIFRKGMKWRIEELRPATNDWRPPAGAGVDWWKEQSKELVFIPRAICDGVAYWDYFMALEWKPGMPAPPKGPGTTVGPNQLMAPADDPALPFWCQALLMEHAGHPTMGIGQPDHDREFVVDRNSTDGPEGTILLRGRDTSPLAAERPDHFRLWLDPEASWVSKRTEIRVHEPRDTSKVAFIDTHVVEAVAKSPKGHSYPTRVKQVATNGQYEAVRSFAVDFEAPLPDELFQPLK